MKYKDLKEARYVRETMASLLMPLINHLDERTQKACMIALRILAETDIEKHTIEEHTGDFGGLLKDLYDSLESEEQA